MRTFLITPAGCQTYLTLAVIFLIMLIPFAALGFAFYGHLKTHSRFAFIDVSGLAVMLAVASLFVYFGYSARHAQFTISEQGLRISRCLYGRQIPRDNLLLDGIMMLDLRQDSNYQPTIRTNGVGLPGYLEGWFKLRNRQKALLFVTQKEKVICIPTIKNYSVLLSTTEPQIFLQTVSQLWK